MPGILEDIHRRNAVSVYSPLRQLRPPGRVANAGTAARVMDQSAEPPEPTTTPRLRVPGIPGSLPGFQVPGPGRPLPVNGVPTTADDYIGRMLAESRARPQQAEEPGGWRGVLGTAVNSLPGRIAMGALNVLDVPRRVVLSTVQEGIDALNGGDADFGDWREQISDPAFGFGSMIGDTGNMWANRIIGFVGDVLLDPLTYVGGAGLISGTGRRMRVSAAASAVAEQFGDDTVRRLGRYGISALSNAERAELRKIGVQALDRGYYFKTPFTKTPHRIPLTGGLDRAVSTPLVGIRAGFNRMAGMPSVRRLRIEEGLEGAVEKLITGRGPMGYSEAAATIKFQQAASLGRGGAEGNLAALSNQMLRQHGNSTLSGMIHEAETKGGNLVNRFFARAADLFEGAGGAFPRGRRTNYVPHILTDEAIEWLKSDTMLANAFRATFFKGVDLDSISPHMFKRTLVPSPEPYRIGAKKVTTTVNGKKVVTWEGGIADFRITEGTIDDINREFKRLMPDAKFKFLDDNFSSIAARYSNSLSEDIGRLTGLRSLANSKSRLVRRLLDESDEVVDDQMTELANSLAGRELKSEVRAGKKLVANLKSERDQGLTDTRNSLTPHLRTALDETEAIAADRKIQLDDLIERHDEAVTAYSTAQQDTVAMQNAVATRNELNAEFDAEIADLDVRFETIERRRAALVRDAATEAALWKTALMNVEQLEQLGRAPQRLARLAEWNEIAVQSMQIAQDRAVLQTIKDSANLAAERAALIRQRIGDESFQQLVLGAERGAPRRWVDPVMGETRQLVPGYKGANGEWIPERWQRVPLEGQKAPIPVYVDATVPTKAAARLSGQQQRTRLLGLYGVADDAEIRQLQVQIGQQLERLERAEQSVDLAASIHSANIAAAQAELGEIRQLESNLKAAVAQFSGYPELSEMRDNLRRELTDMQRGNGEVAQKLKAYEAMQRPIKEAVTLRDAELRHLTDLQGKQENRALELVRQGPSMRRRSPVTDEEIRDFRTQADILSVQANLQRIGELEARQTDARTVIERLQAEIDRLNAERKITPSQAGREQVVKYERTIRRVQDEADLTTDFAAERAQLQTRLQRLQEVGSETLLSPEQISERRAAINRLVSEERSYNRSKQGRADRAKRAELDEVGRQLDNVEQYIGRETAANRPFFIDESGNVILRRQDEPWARKLIAERDGYKGARKIAKTKMDTAHADLAAGIGRKVKGKARQALDRAVVTARKELEAIDGKIQRINNELSLSGMLDPARPTVAARRRLEAFPKRAHQQAAKDKLQVALERRASLVQRKTLLDSELTASSTERALRTQRLDGLQRELAINDQTRRSVTDRLGTGSLSRTQRYDQFSTSLAMMRSNEGLNVQRAARPISYKIDWEDVPELPAAFDPMGANQLVFLDEEALDVIRRNADLTGLDTPAEIDRALEKLAKARTPMKRPGPKTKLGLALDLPTGTAGGDMRPITRAHETDSVAKLVLQEGGIVDKLISMDAFPRRARNKMHELRYELSTLFDRYEKLPNPNLLGQIEQVQSDLNRYVNVTLIYHNAIDVGGAKPSGKLGTLILNQELGREEAYLDDLIEDAVADVKRGGLSDDARNWNNQIAEHRRVAAELEGDIEEMNAYRELHGHYEDIDVFRRARDKLYYRRKRMNQMMNERPEYGALRDAVESAVTVLRDMVHHVDASRTALDNAEKVNAVLRGPMHEQARLEAIIPYNKGHLESAKAAQGRLGKAIATARKQGKDTVRYTPEMGVRRTVELEKARALLEDGQIPPYARELVRKRIREADNEIKRAMEGRMKRGTSDKAWITRSRTVEGGEVVPAEGGGWTLEGGRTTSQTRNPDRKVVAWSERRADTKVVEISLEEAERRFARTEPALISLSDEIDVNELKLSIYDGTASEEALQLKLFLADAETPPTIEALQGANRQIQDLANRRKPPGLTALEQKEIMRNQKRIERLERGGATPEELAEDQERFIHLSGEIKKIQDKMADQREYMTLSLDQGNQFLRELVDGVRPPNKQNMRILRDLMGGETAEYMRTHIEVINDFLAGIRDVGGQGNVMLAEEVQAIVAEFRRVVADNNLGEVLMRRATEMSDDARAAMEIAQSGARMGASTEMGREALVVHIDFMRDEIFKSMTGAARATHQTAIDDLSDTLTALGFTQLRNDDAAGMLRQIGYDVSKGRLSDKKLRSAVTKIFQQVGYEPTLQYEQRLEQLMMRRQRIRTLRQGLGEKIETFPVKDPERFFRWLRQTDAEIKAERGHRRASTPWTRKIKEWNELTLPDDADEIVRQRIDGIVKDINASEDPAEIAELFEEMSSLGAGARPRDPNAVVQPAEPELPPVPPELSPTLNNEETNRLLAEKTTLQSQINDLDLQLASAEARGVADVQQPSALPITPEAMGPPERPTFTNGRVTMYADPHPMYEGWGIKVTNLEPIPGQAPFRWLQGKQYPTPEEATAEIQQLMPNGWLAGQQPPLPPAVPAAAEGGSLEQFAASLEKPIGTFSTADMLLFELEQTRFMRSLPPGYKTADLPVEQQAQLEDFNQRIQHIVQNRWQGEPDAIKEQARALRRAADEEPSAVVAPTPAPLTEELAATPLSNAAEVDELRRLRDDTQASLDQLQMQLNELEGSRLIDDQLAGAEHSMIDDPARAAYEAGTPPASAAPDEIPPQVADSGIPDAELTPKQLAQEYKMVTGELNTLVTSHGTLAQAPASVQARAAALAARAKHLVEIQSEVTQRAARAADPLEKIPQYRQYAQRTAEIEQEFGRPQISYDWYEALERGSPRLFENQLVGKLTAPGGKQRKMLRTAQEFGAGVAHGQPRLSSMAVEAAGLEAAKQPYQRVQHELGQLAEIQEQEARTLGERAAAAETTDLDARQQQLADEMAAETIGGPQSQAMAARAVASGFPERAEDALGRGGAITDAINEVRAIDEARWSAEGRHATEMAEAEQAYTKATQEYTDKVRTIGLQLATVRDELSTVAPTLRGERAAAEAAQEQLDRALNAVPNKDASVTTLLRDFQDINAQRVADGAPTAETAATQAYLRAAIKSQLELNRAQLTLDQVKKRVAQFDKGATIVGDVMKRVIHDGWQPIAPELLRGADRVVIATSLATALDNVTRAMRQPSTWKLLDKYTSFFKTYATMRPGFHVRNLISGIFMNLVDNVRLTDMGRAPHLWRAFSRNPEQFIASHPELRQAFEIVFGSGSSGQFVEVGLGTARTTIGSRGYRALMHNKLTDWNRRAGSAVEGTIRLAMATDSLAKGMSPEQALERINKFHFNYTQMSTLDRQARRMIPFWTFMSRNLPLQIEEMWMRPQAYLHYQSFVRNFSEENDPLTPEYWLAQGAFTMDTDAEHRDQPWYLAPDLPHLRVAEPFAAAAQGEWGKALLSDVNPAITAPYEAFVSGRKEYTGKPIEGYEEPSLPMWPLMPLFNLLGGTATGGTTGNSLVDERYSHVTRSLIPTLEWVERLLDNTGTREGRQDETWMRSFGLPVYQLTDNLREQTSSNRYYDTVDELDRQAELARM